MHRDEDIMRKVARALASIREAHGLTQEDVYTDTGIHIAKIETGSVNITISTLHRICSYYKVTEVDVYLSVASV